MAIHQVVKQGDQKVLVEVPVGGNEKWGKYVEGAVPENPSSLIADMPVGSYVTDDKPTAPTTVPAPYNKEVLITESGTFIVPVTGWYEVWMIGGGGGAMVNTSGITVQGGNSGNALSTIRHYYAGQEIPVTIGAGGVGAVYSGSVPESVSGGETRFGDLTPPPNYFMSLQKENTLAKDYDLSGRGAGAGGGSWGVVGLDGTSGCGRWYGAGGGAFQIRANSTGTRGAGNGAQGAIRLRYYDPNKEESE